MNAFVRRVVSRLRGIADLGTAAAIVGAVAFSFGVALERTQVALAVLEASWLFFAGLATGGVALAAAVRVSRGRWAEAALPAAQAGASYFPVAGAVLVVLVLGRRALSPALAESGAGLALLAARQLAPTALLFALGRRLVARGRGGDPGTTATAVAYLVTYVVALSLWVVDGVLALGEAPPATVLPAAYFVGAFLSGVAWTALVAAAGGTSKVELRHDLGKLLFAMVVVWAYLAWALYLTTWYGNVPAEVELLLRWWRGPWRLVALAVLVSLFLGPFCLLFAAEPKRRRASLALGAASVLGGLWLEQLLLVLPQLELPGGALSVLVGAGIAIGMGGLFLRTVLRADRPELLPDHVRGPPEVLTRLHE